MPPLIVVSIGTKVFRIRHAEESSESNAEDAPGLFQVAFLHGSNEKYATDYPAQVGPHMTNTDSAPFQDLIPTVSLRENERGSQVGAGWDPNWHQVSDVFSTYSDKDFRLGLNAAQTTLGALLHLANGSLKKP